MFTGIIQEIGKIEEIENKKDIQKVTIRSRKLLLERKIGDSIAINGICSTIVAISEKEFTVEYMPESIKRTNLKFLQKDNNVNLELPMGANDRFEGHFVQGHIDTMGEVTNIKRFSKSAELEIRFDRKFTRFMAFKGSVTINGVSLTISKLETGKLTVSLIPHTLKKTNLGVLQIGDKTNIEVDILARYIKSLLDNKEEEVTYEFLRERNLI